MTRPRDDSFPGNTPADTRKRQPDLAPTPPPRDWIAIIITALPGLAALIAVGFTFASVKATQSQVQIAHQEQITAEQGQITDRYNAAIANLGSHSIEIRLGGIYALQRLMQDSPRDQPTVIAVLCAFVRDQAPASAKPLTLGAALNYRQPTDIQAALTVVGTRDTAHDAPATVVDFDNGQLAQAYLPRAHLSKADLTYADLTYADLNGAYLIATDFGGADLRDASLNGAALHRAGFLNTDLDGAGLYHADLTKADLSEANLHGATLAVANLTGARLSYANLTSAYLTGANLTKADLVGANLHGAYLQGANLTSANLAGATLTGANLHGAYLTGVDLTGVDLTGANLTGANLTGVDLAGVDLAGVDLTGADLTGADLTAAQWPADAAVPKGWLRSALGRLLPAK
jgi:uncharacterized protein YjbI with pentapeptide repeats